MGKILPSFKQERIKHWTKPATLRLIPGLTCSGKCDQVK
jgi:hypothetical protein